MKKTLTILAIVVVALVAMMGSVNAVTMTEALGTATGTLEKGTEVSVNISSGEGERGLTFELAYDTSVFSFDKDQNMSDNPTITSINPDYKGTGHIFVVSIGNTVNLKFTVKEAVTVPTEKEGGKAKDLTFTATNVTTLGSDGNEKTVESLSAKYVVNPTAETTEPEPEQKPNTEPEQKPNTEPEQQQPSTPSNGGVVGTDGNVINSLPQTGLLIAPIFVGTIALIAVAGVVFVVRKIKK